MSFVRRRLGSFTLSRQYVPAELLSGYIGTWRNLVAHLAWGQAVVGSNPAVPTFEVAAQGRHLGDEKTAFAVSAVWWSQCGRGGVPWA